MEKVGGLNLLHLIREKLEVCLKLRDCISRRWTVLDIGYALGGGVLVPVAIATGWRMRMW